MYFNNHEITDLLSNVQNSTNYLPGNFKSIIDDMFNKKLVIISENYRIEKSRPKNLEPNQGNPIYKDIRLSISVIFNTLL